MAISLDGKSFLLTPGTQLSDSLVAWSDTRCHYKYNGNANCICNGQCLLYFRFWKESYTFKLFKLRQCFFNTLMDEFRHFFSTLSARFLLEFFLDWRSEIEAPPETGTPHANASIRHTTTWLRQLVVRYENRPKSTKPARPNYYLWPCPLKNHPKKMNKRTRGVFPLKSQPASFTIE